MERVSALCIEIPNGKRFVFDQRGVEGVAHYDGGEEIYWRYEKSQSEAKWTNKVRSFLPSTPNQSSTTLTAIQSYPFTSSSSFKYHSSLLFFNRP
ncbi:hypothetical protein L2E82_22373 [Cichorium intybus]|uniref:Uncharacterized protein n=1 Tax=Cichorium intybus TaxID=13427 RepID=A0ACB9DXX9_CICIN|nr:hypothetical protein L2E82_22373 [Cichorium intybus]